MSETIFAANREVTVTHPDKVMFPADGITKADLVAYYIRVAPSIIPHLRDRPLMMQRFPEGIAGGGFYQKDVPNYFPEWIRRIDVPKKGGTVTHVVCDDAATLAYIVNQNCITPHPWLSRVGKLDRPDRMMFDLDPSTDDFVIVREGALVLKELLDELKLPSFVKTTGSRGLHIVVPLAESGTYDDVRGMSEDIAAVLVGRLPKTMTVEGRKAQREKRVYVDVMRNGYAQTAVPAFAVRVRDGAPVSVPLAWREVRNRKLRSDTYTLTNIFRRLGQKEDPWEAFGRSRRSLKEARRRLEKMM
ncbi:MAG: non-homologous end-joining DNA ligase [Actinomycetota bacterium]|nr:non-homologous end-joining DNA ligase [Actinomycetota bacterium]